MKNLGKNYYGEFVSDAFCGRAIFRFSHRLLREASVGEPAGELN